MHACMHTYIHMYACMHFLCANIPQEQCKDIHVPRKTLWRQDNVSTWYRFVARCRRHDGQSVISQFCIWVCIVLRMWHSLAALYLYLMDYGISYALSRTRYYGSGFLVRTPSSFCVCHWIITKRQLQLLIVWLPKCSLLIAVLLDVSSCKLLQCGEWMWVGHLHLDKIRCLWPMKALRIRSRSVSAAPKRSKSSNSSFPKQLPMLGWKRQNVLNPAETIEESAWIQHCFDAASKSLPNSGSLWTCVGSQLWMNTYENTCSWICS